MTKPVIGIVGANGQVGAEVALLLARLGRVVPIVRTEAGAQFLRWLGLSPRVSRMESSSSARAALEGCSLVADFSLPPIAQPPSLDRKRIAGLLRATPLGVPYVFISTTMAFGMESLERDYRPRLIARTQYAAAKRRAERFVLASNTAEHPTFVLRLGQVHGDLQRVSHSIRSLLWEGRPIFAPRGVDGPSDTVFCSTIAVALLNIAAGQETPGRYTLVEHPDLTHRELLEFWARSIGRAVAITAADLTVPSLRQRLTASARGFAGATLLRHKEFLLAQFRPPRVIDARIRAWNARRRVAAELGVERRHLSVIFDDRQGRVPGARLKSLHLDAHKAAATEAAIALRLLLRERRVIDYGPSTLEPDEGERATESITMGE